MTDYTRYAIDVDDDSRLGLWCNDHESPAYVTSFFRGDGGSAFASLMAAADDHNAARHDVTDQTQQTGHDTEAPGRIAEIRCRHANATDGPWTARDTEDAWSLHAGMLQILKAPKHSTPYAEYWPDPCDAELLIHARSDIGWLLAALDSAQDAAAKLIAENDTLFVDYSTEKTQHELFSAAFDEVRAGRDRLAARVDQLETLLGQILARFDTKGHPGYAAIRTAWIRAELVAMWRKVAKGRDAGESGDETDAEATAEPMPLGEAFETLRELPVFESWRADATTPTCSPTPNALICACGAPINHEGARP